jgi:pyruvate/2-oxoglutarate dehydrogenase complex dihydrolipoamide dehydrogenase (E3) component
VIAEKPDAVIVATGGVPDLSWLEGGDHCTSVWDALNDPGSARGDVIVFDGTGRHAAVSAALHMGEHGQKVEYVTIDDNVGLEMEYSSRVVYRQRFAKNGVKIHGDQQLITVEPRGNRLIATFRHELTGAVMQLEGDHVVVENGTVPVTDVFDALRVGSVNHGVTDVGKLLKREPQAGPPAQGSYELHLIGDAVASRGVHSAIYDAYRLVLAM